MTYSMFSSLVCANSSHNSLYVSVQSHGLSNTISTTTKLTGNLRDSDFRRHAVEVFAFLCCRVAQAAGRLSTFPYRHSLGNPPSNLRHPTSHKNKGSVIKSLCKPWRRMEGAETDPVIFRLGTRCRPVVQFTPPTVQFPEKQHPSVHYNGVRVCPQRRTGYRTTSRQSPIP
jgi:hypothetical protein